MQSTAKIFQVVILFILSAISFTYGMSEEEILSGADARIEKYRKGDAVLEFAGPGGESLSEGVVVSVEQVRHEFLFGCNIFKLGRCRTDEDNAAYAKYYSEIFNFATLPFYWWAYSDTSWNNDRRIDEVVKWCVEQGITPKGHPLAWNFRDPEWLPEDLDRVMKMQFDRIERCVDRFEGKIDIWDVVNEATHYDRAKCVEQSPMLTAGITKMRVGAYLRKSFETARKANRGATLIINDYRNDKQFADRVLKELVGDEGKPMFDVIGIQSHMHGKYWGAEKTWEVCEKYADFGVPIHFTETTIVSGPKTDKVWETTAEGEERQAKEAVEFYTVLFSHPGVEAITWWDFSDQGAWQGAPAGFLRKDMSPKPVYHALKKLIKNKWRTVADVKTKAGGAAEFRGFYGRYKVSVKSKGKELNGSFEFGKNTKDRIKVLLK